MDHRKLLHLFRLLLVYWQASSLVLCGVRHPVPVLWMVPVSSGPDPENMTDAVAPAVRQALKDLQRQPPPLGNYELQLQLLYSQCDAATSLKALFDALWAGPRYMLLFGGVCPSVTSLIARALPAFHLVQVSFVSPSSSLSNRKWYGNLFSTVPSDWALSRAAIKLLQHYKWTRVGVMALPERSKDLMRWLLKENLQVVSTGSLAEDICSSMKKLKESDVRIIVGYFEEDVADEVFCCAYRLNMFGAQYQWIVVGGWSLGRRASGCTSDSLLTASNGTIRLQIRHVRNMKIPEDVQEDTLRRPIQGDSQLTQLAAFAYDAVWVAAKAVSQVMEMVKHREKYHSQRSTSLAQEEVHRMLLEALKHTNFEGLTGKLFYRNGERMATVELVQHQGRDSVLVGDFSTWKQQLDLRTQLLRFNGPGPARDRPVLLLQQLRVPLRVYMVVSSAAALAIILTVTILFLTTVNHKYRRPRSGSQDELLLLGLLLSSSSILVSGLDEASLSSWTSELLCSIRMWTLWVGHTLTFAVIFTRMWMLYSICTHVHQAGRVVLWVVLSDLCVLTSWQLLDPLRWVVLQHGSQTDPTDPDILVQLFSEQCSSANMELWLTAVFGYKGPLLVLGCYLAWSISAVSHPAEGSKGLTLTMFTLTAFSVSGATVSLLTSHNPSLQFCLSSVLILFCHASTLSFLFPIQTPQPAEEDHEEEEQLEVEEWKSRAAQLDVEIQTLMSQLSESEHQTLLHNSAGNIRELRCLHDAQICPADRNSNNPSSPDALNSPEQMWRRLSVQLPILHHSYMPAVGGISASNSSLWGSTGAFVHYNLTTTSTPPESHSC
ncbi:gamma-aminobutyric acid type B receptor subunit 2-like isoform X1 [Takifugu rubripes]|uniref:gamma-aminobutyric acid type B receptor subunit 2-like isoform X1 n=1 Tax=Takifugu rubripes TaxID=31033 RepID=UPI0011452D32|nr:gamma-aminobutyric acid type B receptor subunit 2-like isoform X1 [Takifugu rubripes]